MSSSSQLVWCSVDPVRRKIDFYPKAISARLEAAFADWRPAINVNAAPGECVLGSDFFNATVHFHPNGLFYQTTPGINIGRSGFKQPGYRTVKRILVEDGQTQIKLFTKRVSGEWRFCEVEIDAEHTFSEPVPTDNMVQAVGGGHAVPIFRPWTATDMQSVAWDLPVVVWQWCRGVPERNGNLLHLSEDWWCPYMEDVNANIEVAFQSGAKDASVQVIGRDYRITFDRTSGGSMFALQHDERKHKERTVRRVVKTVQELKASLEVISRPSPSSLDLEALPEGACPHHFLCPIFQDIMDDPVRTVDGHTYDRAAIETWFRSHETSPLTGLVLASKVLTPHAELKAQITAFVAKHAPASTGTA